MLILRCPTLPTPPGTPPCSVPRSFSSPRSSCCAVPHPGCRKSSPPAPWRAPTLPPSSHARCRGWRGPNVCCSHVWNFSPDRHEQIIGFIGLLLAVILFPPIPLGNMLPALAICLFSLAILERDGLAALIGVALSVLSVVLVWGVLFVLIKGALFLIGNVLSR